MEFFITELPDAVWVRLDGDLDLASDAPLEALLLGAEGRAPRLVVDLRAVGFVDRAGMAAVLAAHGRASRAGRPFSVLPGAAARRLIDLLGLEHELPLEDDPSELAHPPHGLTEGPVPARGGAGADEPTPLTRCRELAGDLLCLQREWAQSRRHCLALRDRARAHLAQQRILVARARELLAASRSPRVV